MAEEKEVRYLVDLYEKEKVGSALKVNIEALEDKAAEIYDQLKSGIPVSYQKKAVLSFNMKNISILLEHSGVGRRTPAKAETSIPADSVSTTTFTIAEPFVCIEREYGPVTCNNFGKVHYAVYVDSETANIAVSKHKLYVTEYGDFGQYWLKRNNFYVKAWNYDEDYASEFLFYYKGLLVNETFWDSVLKEELYYYDKIARVI